MALRPNYCTTNLGITNSYTQINGVTSPPDQISFDCTPDARWVGFPRRLRTNSLTIGTDGTFVAPHLDGGVYHCTFLIRFKQFPTSEEVIVTLGPGTGGGAGMITIDNNGDMRLYTGLNWAGRQILDSTYTPGGVNGAGFGTVLNFGLNIFYTLEFYWDGAQPSPPSGVETGIWPYIRLSHAQWPTGSAAAALGFECTGVSAVPAGGTALLAPGGWLLSVAFTDSVGGPVPSPNVTWYDLALYVCQNRLGDETQVTPSPGLTYFWRPSGGLLGFASQTNLLIYPRNVYPTLINAGSYTRVSGPGGVNQRLVQDHARSTGIVLTSQIQSIVSADVLEFQYDIAGDLGFAACQGMMEAWEGLGPLAGGLTSTMALIDPAGPTTLKSVTFSSGYSNPYVWLPTGSAPEVSTVPGTMNVRLTRPASVAVGVIHSCPIVAFSQVQPPNYGGGSPNVCLLTGTYTGDGIGQSISVDGLHPRWVFIAAVGATTPGVWGWDTQVGQSPWGLLASINFGTFRLTATGFDVIGNDTSTNLNGQSYRWFAILDSTRRLIYPGAVQMPAGTISGETSVPPASFSPSLFWAVQDRFDGTNVIHAVRGPGHTGLNSSPLNGAENTTHIRSMPAGGGTWDKGSSLSGAALQVSLLSWSLQFITTTLWSILTYTGNGGGTRSIPVVLNGGTPGLVVVVPHNGVSWLRHRDHAANTSQNFTSATTSTTAIRAFAPDAVEVGSTLNASGVVYEMLCLLDPAGGHECDNAPTGACTLSMPTGADSGGGLGCPVTL